MASTASDPLALMKDLCVDILDCCAQIQTVLLKLKESLRRKDAAMRLQAAAHGFLARQRGRLLRGTKRTNCTSLQPSEVVAPLLQIGTPVACWEPLAIVSRRDNIVRGLVLVVPLAICLEQQDIILRRGAITGGATPTTIRMEPPVVVLLHVSRFVHSWSFLVLALDGRRQVWWFSMGSRRNKHHVHVRTTRGL